MKYAIFTDVDGTIYTWENKKIHKKTIEGIKEAQKKGVEVILCTGNPYHIKMINLMDKLNIRYLIGSNGGIIVDNLTKQVISQILLPRSEANNILQIATKLDIKTSWYGKDVMFVSENTDYKQKELVKLAADLKELPTNKKYIENDLLKIEFWGTIEQMDDFEEIIKKKDVRYYRMTPTFIEIIPNNISKGEGVKKFVEKFKLDLANIMTIGDSWNDHSMFEISGFSYAMANSDKITKQKAKYHTSTHYQGGLGEAIIDYLYRNRLTDNFKNNR